MTTCSSAKIQWSYAGRSADLVLLIAASTIRHVPSPTTSRRDGVVALPIAFGLNSTLGSWTWPIVNVTSGWYSLEAAGVGVATMSSDFFVANGTDTSCLAESEAPIAFHAGTTSLSNPGMKTVVSAGPDASHLVAAPDAASATEPCTKCSTPGDSGMVLGVTLGGTVILAAAVLAVYRFLIMRFLRHRRPHRRITQHRVADLDPAIPQGTSLRNLPEEKRPVLNSTSAVTRPLPPLPSDDHQPTFIPPLKLDTIPIVVPSESEPRKRTARPVMLAKLDTDVSRTAGLSSYSAPPTRGSLYATDRSDAASSVWARRFSAASTWSGGQSRRGSPVPSSATSVMYRVRDSAASAWALVRPNSLGVPDREASGILGLNVHRKAASFDGLRAVRTPTAIPDVPPLPVRFQAEGR